MFQRSYGQQTGVFHNHLVILHHIQECHDEFIILHRDDVIQIFLDIRENLASRCLDRCAVRNGVDLRQRRYFSCRKGSLHTVCARRLHADDLDLRIQKLRQCGHAGCQSAPSDRNQNILHQRKLLKDLHGDRSLSGCNGQIVERMDKSISLLVRKLVRFLARLVVDVSVKHDFRTVTLGAVHLDERCRGRHDDDCLAAVALCCVCHTLRVVSRRCRDQPLCTLLIT